jgi:hypothetical protein
MIALRKQVPKQVRKTLEGRVEIASVRNYHRA